MRYKHFSGIREIGADPRYDVQLMNEMLIELLASETEF